MTKSMVFAALLVLAACARNPAPPPPTADAAPTSLTAAFVPYCGPVWSVSRQGYLFIPCPPGSNYSTIFPR